MNPLIVGQVFIGAACLALSAMHFAVARRRPGSRVHVWFALAALFAAGNALTEAVAYEALTVPAFNRAFKLEILFQGLTWIALVWYVAEYARGFRRWLAVSVTVGFALSLIVHLISPYGVLFSNIEGLVRVELSWTTFSLASGPASAWRLLSDATTLAFIAYVVDAWIGLVRRGEARRATRLGIATALILAALVHGSLVDVGLVRTPYLMSLGFLFTVGIMGLDLADDAVRAASLAREVVAKERRWSALLDRVQLLVAGIDARGQIDYVNPFFSQVMGYTDNEAIGLSFVDFLPESEWPRAEEDLRQSLMGSPVPFTELRMKTKGGAQRIVLWSNVTVHDATETTTGTIGVGTDVTERRRAESSRDAALRELEILHKELEEENLYLKEEIRLERDFTNIIGSSDALRYVLHRVEQVAGTNTTVLIEGETGVGKELVARAIHDASPRAAGPFVKVNCATLPANLIESELFGHEAGAFTGAVRQRKGRFEVANGGTILLDEIGELPLELQSKLLRILQEGEFERIGSSTTRQVDARIVAATNEILSDLVEAKRFREDLFYRLHIYPITVPPLRDRRSDIPQLVHHFVNRFAKQTGRAIEEVPAATMSALRDYDWPGNIRELQNVLERAVITSRGSVLGLPEPLVAGATANAPAPLDSSRLQSLEDVEKHHIRSVLLATEGRVAGPGGAAEILAMHPNTLRSRMKKLGIGAAAGSAKPAVASS